MPISLPSALSPQAEERLRRVRLLLVDVDGVLTDGGLYYGNSGEEMKRFDVKDGAGMWIAGKLGLEVGIITGKTSEVVARRAAELGMTRVVQGAMEKSAALDGLLSDGTYPLNEVAFMGDDVLDLPVMRRVGFSACPADAHEAVRGLVHHVCSRGGGRGAVRELVDLWLQATGKLPEFMKRFGWEENPHA